MSDQSRNCTSQHQKCLENVRCPTVISCALVFLPTYESLIKHPNKVEQNTLGVKKYKAEYNSEATLLIAACNQKFECQRAVLLFNCCYGGIYVY